MLRELWEGVGCWIMAVIFNALVIGGIVLIWAIIAFPRVGVPALLGLFFAAWGIDEWRAGHRGLDPSTLRQAQGTTGLPSTSSGQAGQAGQAGPRKR